MSEEKLVVKEEQEREEKVVKQEEGSEAAQPPQEEQKLSKKSSKDDKNSPEPQEQKNDQEEPKEAQEPIKQAPEAHEEEQDAEKPSQEPENDKKEIEEKKVTFSKRAPGEIKRRMTYSPTKRQDGDESQSSLRKQKTHKTQLTGSMKDLKATIGEKPLVVVQEESKEMEVSQKQPIISHREQGGEQSEKGEGHQDAVSKVKDDPKAEQEVEKVPEVEKEASENKSKNQAKNGSEEPGEAKESHRSQQDAKKRANEVPKEIQGQDQNQEPSQKSEQKIGQNEPQGEQIQQSAPVKNYNLNLTAGDIIDNPQSERPSSFQPTDPAVLLTRNEENLIKTYYAEKRQKLIDPKSDKPQVKEPTDPVKDLPPAPKRTPNAQNTKKGQNSEKVLRFHDKASLDVDHSNPTVQRFYGSPETKKTNSSQILKSSHPKNVFHSFFQKRAPEHQNRSKISLEEQPASIQGRRAKSRSKIGFKSKKKTKNKKSVNFENFEIFNQRTRFMTRTQEAKKSSRSETRREQDSGLQIASKGHLGKLKPINPKSVGRPQNLEKLLEMRASRQKKIIKRAKHELNHSKLNNTSPHFFTKESFIKTNLTESTHEFLQRKLFQQVMKPLKTKKGKKRDKNLVMINFARPRQLTFKLKLSKQLPPQLGLKEVKFKRAPVKRSKNAKFRFKKFKRKRAVLSAKEVKRGASQGKRKTEKQLGMTRSKTRARLEKINRKRAYDETYNRELKFKI